MDARSKAWRKPASQQTILQKCLSATLGLIDEYLTSRELPNHSYHHGFPLEFFRNSIWSLIKATSINLSIEKDTSLFRQHSKECASQFYLWWPVGTSKLQSQTVAPSSPSINSPILHLQSSFERELYATEQGQGTHKWLRMASENWHVFLIERETRLKVGKKQWRKERKSENMARMPDSSTNSPVLA